MNIISTYKKTFKDNVIGLSDHENGIDAGPIAYMLGARYFEKHFTIDRSFKGTDNAFSLEPEGLRKFVRNLNRIPKMLGSFEKKILPSEEGPIKKMAKSIVCSRDLPRGHLLSDDDLEFKSPGGGLRPFERNLILGKKLILDKRKEELILDSDVSHEI